MNHEQWDGSASRASKDETIPQNVKSTPRNLRIAIDSQASVKIKNNKAGGKVNSDRQSKLSGSNPLFNTRTSEHEEITLLFRTATDKLDQVEENAEKEKQQIVRDLAQELEKFRPIDRIASEIVEKLRKKVSKSVVYAALDERYKTSYRVQNARKRKKKKENKTLSLAPTSELKPLIVNRSGHGTQQLVSEPYSSDDADDNKPQDSKPVNINEKQKVDSSNSARTDTNSLLPVTRDVTECEHSQLKDSSNDEEGSTKAESKEESTIASPINQNEDLMDTKKKVLVTHIAMPFEHLQRDTYAISQRTNGMGNIFWKLSIDLVTRVAKIEFC